MSSVQKWIDWNVDRLILSVDAVSLEKGKEIDWYKSLRLRETQ